MKEVAIEVSELCIYYRNLTHMSIHQSLSNRNALKAADVIHAVNGVSFSVDRGDILGIIGKNGSGKSTLLKAIAGIFQPDSGTVDTRNRKVSLMSVGVGFKPDITGRENILTSGMLLGYKQDYIKSKMQEIIEFSELGEFIDRPVRTYSSGMYSKLSFAITAIIDNDIMLIDEVLSVGDAHFQKKSSNKMRELIFDNTRTVLIVSHAISTLRELCNRVMWMHDGQIRMLGETQEVLNEYEKYMKY